MSTVDSPEFRIRNVTLSDIPQLLELEKEWPEDARASLETLTFRINFFQDGYFIAEDESGIIASIIACPYQYDPSHLSSYKNWEVVTNACYQTPVSLQNKNALYIVSGTSKSTRHGGKVFDGGVMHVVELAKRLGIRYVVGGCLLPGYSRYIGKYENISASEYVFRKMHERFIDPLIEKYSRLSFHVPNQAHVIADYFPHEPSMNYSALVVRDLG